MSERLSELDALRFIVGGLADAADPMEGGATCVLCGAFGDRDHFSSCPWLLAVEWVRSQPPQAEDDA